MSEKQYANSIEKGAQLLKRSMESKTDKNKISLAKKSIEHFEKSRSNALLLNLKKKIPLINEYITQLFSVIAVSNLKLKNDDEAIKYFKQALTANNETLKNSRQREREAFITSELSNTYLKLKNLSESKNSAIKALKIGKELENEDQLDLFIELNPIFIKTVDFDRVRSNYKTMIKLAKRSKRKGIKAQVYFDYARFLFTIEKDYSQTKEYLNKTMTLYSSINSPQAVEIIQKYYDSNFDESGNPILSSNIKNEDDKETD